jgi:hypothetical protein
MKDRFFSSSSDEYQICELHRFRFIRFARADMGIMFPQVRVEVHGGMVVLSGTVKDSIERGTALALAGPAVTIGAAFGAWGWGFGSGSLWPSHINGLLLDRRVIDQTLPTGNYDFLIVFTPKMPGFWP